jgi:hypothetical protein
MRCLSCDKPLVQSDIKLFHKIVVCGGCNELAEKAEREIEARIEAAKQHSLNWLDQHILSGGLLRGGSGFGESPGPAGPSLPAQAEVRELRNTEVDRRGEVPVADRKHPAATRLR